MQLKINWKNQRVKHCWQRMKERGISREEFIEAINKAPRKKQKDNIYKAIYRHYAIVYREIIYGLLNIRKIFPITVEVIE